MRKRIICFLLVFAMLIPFTAGIGEAATGELKPVYIPDKEMEFERRKLTLIGG